MSGISFYQEGLIKDGFNVNKGRYLHYSGKRNIYELYAQKYIEDLEQGKFNNLVVHGIRQLKNNEGALYDRFDWTLKLIQVYYECINEECEVARLLSYMRKTNCMLEKIVNKSKNKTIEDIATMPSRFSLLYYGLDNSRDWLLLFDNFAGFSESYCLIDSFVDRHTNDIINSADWFPLLPKNYEDYMWKTTEQIKNRNLMLSKF